MFKRIKRLYALTKKDPEFLEKLEKLSDKELSLIPEEVEGVFIGPGTQEEWENQVKEDKGLKGIFGL